MSAAYFESLNIWVVQHSPQQWTIIRNKMFFKNPCLLDSTSLLLFSVFAKNVLLFFQTNFISRFWAPLFRFKSFLKPPREAFELSTFLQHYHTTTCTYLEIRKRCKHKNETAQNWIGNVKRCGTVDLSCLHLFAAHFDFWKACANTMTDF